MAHQVPWNRSIYNTFCDLAMLSDLEMQVLGTRIRNWDRAAQCEAFHLTPGRLDAIISTLKAKYDCVQPLSPILPPRRKNAKETWGNPQIKQ